MLWHPFWRLEGIHAVPEEDTEAWIMWMAQANRHLALSRFADGTWVSTVFLGTNARTYGPPAIFETMVFSHDDKALDEQRYATWLEAMTGHRATVRQLGALHAHVPL